MWGSHREHNNGLPFARRTAEPVRNRLASLSSHGCDDLDSDVTSSSPAVLRHAPHPQKRHESILSLCYPYSQQNQNAPASASSNSNYENPSRPAGSEQAARPDATTMCTGINPKDQLQTKCGLRPAKWSQIFCTKVYNNTDCGSG